eukprot:GILI01027112.1.p1 GENE.GILI01027112.1~~GILI01027112.1.p1  ORF type:complete len:242 (-),score=49.96 GILI01027112.1:93-818(-)
MLCRRFLGTKALVSSQIGIRSKYVASSFENVDENGNRKEEENPKSTPTPSSSSNSAPSNSSPSTSNPKNETASNASATANFAKAATPETPEVAKTPEQIKEEFIEELIKRDKELFELKRQHELSMLRVQQHQNRIMHDQHDRGIYYEQTVNVHTFETVTVGQYTQRNTMHHVIGLQKLRNFKIQVAIATTFYIWAFIVYRYIVNPDMQYVEAGIKKLGDNSSLRAAYKEEERKREFDKLNQ